MDTIHGCITYLQPSKEETEEKVWSDSYNFKRTMVKIINIFNNYSHKVLRALVPSFSGMLRVKAGRPLVNWLLGACALVKGSITNSLVKVSVSYIRTLYSMSRRSGLAFTVKYLKASVSLLMQSISGAPHKSSQELGCAVSRTKAGIPRIIPRLHREHIRQGNTFYIRLWLTLLSLYRVLDYTGALKVKTIINSSSSKVDVLEVKRATSDFMRSYRLPIIDTSPGVLEVKPYWISTTSPNSTKSQTSKTGPKLCSTAIQTIIGSLLAIGQDKMLRRNLMEYCYAFGIETPIVNAISFSKFASRYLPDMLANNKGKDSIPIVSSYIGKLAYKVEPAGKIRVFAMVDCFTQWLMAPLHSELFKRLSYVSQDGTHNQSDTLRTFVQSLADRSIRDIFSFDLSAATDRMPVYAQALVMDVLTNRPIGPIWASALVDRWYQLPAPKFGKLDQRLISCQGLSLEAALNHPHIRLSYPQKVSSSYPNGSNEPYISAVRYAVGQPMGALSSWAMLAVTHHVMVFMAANRAGILNFRDYLVLGDDLVIAHKAVAKHYLAIAKEWDIEINLSKSILSRNGSLEFAKRFIYKYQDVSGLSFKEMAVSRKDLRGLVQLFERIASFRDVKLSQVLSFLGYGYRALSRMTGKYSKISRNMARALLLLSYPGSRYSTLDSVSAWILSPSLNKPGIVNMPDEAIEYVKSLALEVADLIPQSPTPRNPDEYYELWRNILGCNLSHSFVLDTEALNQFYDKSLALGRTLEEALMPMYYELIEDWDTTVVEVKDTFEFDEELDFDTCWDYLTKLEDISSQVGMRSAYVSNEDILTLNRSSLLKRADKVRSYIRSLSLNPAK